MDEQQGPPPMQVEWHDNITAIDVSELVDPTPIIMGHDRVFTVPTSKGKLVFHKISDTRVKQLALKHKDLFERMAPMMARAAEILSKPAEERTLDDMNFLNEYGLLGQPYSIELTHASLVAPAMTLEIFEALLDTLSTKERDAIVLTVADIYNPSAEAMEAAKNLIRLAQQFNIPIDKNLTLANMTSDQVRALSEIARENKVIM
jgi:hypothetical protein